MWHTLSLVAALLTIAAMNLLIKAGANTLESQQQAGGSLSLLSLLSMIKTAMGNPWIIGAMICGILNFITYMYALKKFQVSTAYPIMISVSCIIIAIGAGVFFSERLNVWQIAGMVLIIAGVWMIVGMAKTA
jgi:multidrug transporter EmrE-like cation transporter